MTAVQMVEMTAAVMADWKVVWTGDSKAARWVDTSAAKSVV